MAESADILTADTQPVVLPDLAAGCSMADMAAIGQVEDALGRAGRRRRRRRRRAGDLHELLRRDQGVHRPARRHDLHVVATPGRRCSGRSTSAAADGRQGAVPARPAPRPQHRACASSGCRSSDCVVFDPHKPSGGLTREQLQTAADDPVARALLGARPVQPRRRAGRARADPRRQGDRAPRVPARGRRGRRRRRLDREDHPDHRRRAGRHGVGGRHRAQPGQAPGREFPRQQIVVPGEERLLLLDDEPDRPAAPGLGAGVARRRRVVNQISVDPEVARWARVALDQMLALPGETSKD